MKLEVDYQSGYYQWKLWDGPDGIDYYAGSAKSLGCAMEQIIQKRHENARFYTDDLELKTKHLLMKKTKFPWPHHIDEETKNIFVYVASGYPTVMLVPKKVEEYFPGYTARLCSESYLEELKK